MELLIFLAVFLFLFLVFGTGNKKLVTHRCDVHKWQYDIKGELFCKTCKYVPTSETRDDYNE